MTFSKKQRDLLKSSYGVPLTYGTMAFVGGKLPGTMGTTVTSSMAGSAPMVGVASKVAMTGVALEQMKKSFNINRWKR